MNDKLSEQKTISRLPVIIVILILFVLSIVFVVLFIALSDEGVGAIHEDDLTEDSYMDRVEPLLADAEPTRALDVIYGEDFNCASCHLNDVALGPSYNLLPDVASERRPPLQAAAYIYESILYPTAFEVQGGWPANMPINFGDRLTDQQLGDVIAWLLLSPDERPVPDSP